MSAVVNPRREAARGFFEFLERQLQADEVLTDKECVRRLVDKARAEHAERSRKRFDPEAAFRVKLLYGRIDDAVAVWCRKRALRADPFQVFRYEGPERGPTQHETALGPSMPLVRRAFDRLADRVPELPDVRAAIRKPATSAVAPAFRLQSPLPFGAAGEVRCGGTRDDLGRAVYLTAMDVATTGDPARGWRYDCGLLVFYARERLPQVLGESLSDAWPDVRARVWEAARVWLMAL